MTKILPAALQRVFFFFFVVSILFLQSAVCLLYLNPDCFQLLIRYDFARAMQCLLLCVIALFWGCNHLRHFDCSTWTPLPFKKWCPCINSPKIQLSFHDITILHKSYYVAVSSILLSWMVNLTLLKSFSVRITNVCLIQLIFCLQLLF